MTPTRVRETSPVVELYSLVQPMQNLPLIGVLCVKQKSIPYMPALNSEVCLMTTKCPL